MPGEKKEDAINVKTKREKFSINTKDIRKSRSESISSLDDSSVLSCDTPKSPKANSTSTMFLTSTISVPNNDEIILSVSTVLQCQMLNDSKNVRKYVEKTGSTFDFFNDDYYVSSSDRNKSIKRAPSVGKMYQVRVRNFYNRAQFSPECNVISLVYINRLMAFSEIKLHSKNWRPILLSALLLAQKVWDDKCLANVDFPVIWRHAVPRADASLLNLKAINNFEIRFLELLSYNVTVSASLYAKYYFELRSLCESNMRTFGLEPLSAEQASKLEASGRALVSSSEISLKETRSAFTASDMKVPTRSRAIIS